MRRLQLSGASHGDCQRSRLRCRAAAIGLASVICLREKDDNNGKQDKDSLHKRRSLLAAVLSGCSAVRFDQCGVAPLAARRPGRLVWRFREAPAQRENLPESLHWSRTQKLLLLLLLFGSLLVFNIFNHVSLVLFFFFYLDVPICLGREWLKNWSFCWRGNGPAQCECAVVILYSLHLN